MMSGPLHICTALEIAALTRKREGEIRLGECVQCIADPQDWEGALSRSDARFVLLGVPEDIGVRANYGVGGAHTAWEPTLAALLNIQSTAFLSGPELLVLGHIRTGELMQRSRTTDVAGLRALVEELDALLAPVISAVVAAAKVPIIIGGGHNNCYPIISGVAAALGNPVASINFDAHSDFRVKEGRHSGNGFRYAMDAGSLARYAVLGLHENYNSQAVVRDLQAHPGIEYSFFEDIFVRTKYSFEEACEKAYVHTDGFPCGIELDVDAVEQILSSAITPSGLSTLIVRRWIHDTVIRKRPCYFHITEAAVALDNGLSASATGKLLAYFISDFIKAYRIPE